MLAGVRLHYSCETPPMLIRRTHVGAALVLAITACIFPTDTCACTWPPPSAKAFGFVRGATGSPVAEAAVTVSAARAPCDASAQTSPLTVQTSTIADGSYRVVILAPVVGSTCVFVRATSAGGASASATAIVQGRMETREAFLDSVRVDVQLP